MRAFALLLTFVLSVAACAEEAAAPKYEEGKHYKTIANPIKSPSDKVEITEFFWYGCGHCYVARRDANPRKSVLHSG